MPVNREQALSVLCDLAFTIGSEVTPEALLLKTLQRFLYHTGFAAGFMFAHPELKSPAAYVEVMLDAAIGDYGFIQRQGKLLRVPSALLPNAPVLLDSPALLAELGTRKTMQVALCLPVPKYGHMVLVSPRLPQTQLPLTDLFLPVLSRLSNSITLCRGYADTILRRIEREAHYDPVTELPNQVLFMEALQEALQRARRSALMVAVVYLDMDAFSQYNERFGKATTDRMLASFARQLDSRTHPSEMTARMMADEFIILLPDMAGFSGIEERLNSILGEAFVVTVGQQQITLSVSTGVSVFPVDTMEDDTLVRNAQMAMHDAKSSSRGWYRFFDAAQDKELRIRRALHERVAHALGNGEFRLYYQPKVNALSGEVIGFEALLRWHDPQLGLRMPGDFLPAVEATDLICRIGLWAMEEALKQGIAWRSEGIRAPISVNIASHHLLQEDFLEQMDGIFARYPEAHREDMEIEILESTAIEDFDKARQVLLACQATGVKTALDDFGTGYSSLAYLSQLPANVLKIDQMFVRNLFQHDSEPAIIRAIVQIAEVFDCHVVAEGVESEEHGLVLISMGCHLAQGYGVARPMPADQVVAWTRQYRAPESWRNWNGEPWSQTLYDSLKVRYRQRTES